MINKQKLWFLTLFSLILVLSVYYITMPNPLVETIENTVKEVEEESNPLELLKSVYEDTQNKNMDDLRLVITDEKTSISEKNDAYGKIKDLESNKIKEEQLEDSLKDKFKLESFIKITNNNIEVLINNNKHDYKIANDIMRFIQEKFDNKVYISVKFQ